MALENTTQSCHMETSTKCVIIIEMPNKFHTLNSAMWMQNSQWYLKSEFHACIYPSEYQASKSLKIRCSSQCKLQIQCLISSTSSHP